ncbi:MAG TPA: hypothetical protein VJA94_16220 [Candidatus Angelobacter sp.]
MSYLVSSPIKTNWHMTPTEFISKLLERWPKAQARARTFASPFSHDWKIHMPAGVLEGKFNQNYSGISIEGELEDCAAFALWFRSVVPGAQPLLFYDDCFSVDVPLTAETTVADLVAAFQ